MAKNQVLIQFILSAKNDPSCTLMFWSSVLETDVEKVDTKFLESNFDDVSVNNHINLKTEFKKFDKKNDLKYQRRNPVFLSIDCGHTKGSPYQSACSFLENYYDADFLKKYAEFIQKIEKLSNFCFSEYDKLQIQQNVISEIRKLIGLDVLDHGSIPGSIAIYRRLPRFSREFNFNVEKGARYIAFSFDKEKDCSYLLDIEIPDDDGKILYKEIHNLEPEQKINLPGLDELESFGRTHFSIYKKDSTGKTAIVFEERGALIRSISIGMNVSGGNHKIIQNRFLSKKKEEIALNDYSNFVIGGKKDVFDIELDYKKEFFGKERKYLGSFFFSDDESGRKKFLDWTRNVLQTAKEVCIIDPFFDLDGLNDFNSCVTTYFNLTILTTDPLECPRDSVSKSNTESKDLLNEIYRSFSNAQVYFLKRNKLHDRYLIVDKGNDSVYYCLSNSWNGTVNNYSLFIQELELPIALQVKNVYSKYLVEENLQKRKTSKQKKVPSTPVFSEEEIQKDFLWLKELNKKVDNGIFEESVCRLLQTEYKGCDLFKGKSIFPVINSKIKYLDNLNEFVKLLVVKILESQKAVFSSEKKILQGPSLENISEINECIRLVSHNYYYGDISVRDLKIDYCRYIILKAVFAVDPAVVINILVEKEKEICSIENHNYYVSLHLVSCMVSGLLDEFPDRTLREWIEFANKTQDRYCKVFIAQWILHQKDDLTLEDRLKLLCDLEIEPENFIVILANLYTEQRFAQKDSLQNHKDVIDGFVYNRFIGNKKCLITFAMKAFLTSYEIDFPRYEKFVNRNPEVKEDLQMLFLLNALNSSPSRKLFEVLEKNVDKTLFGYLPCQKISKSIVDVRKYISHMPYLGSILCNQIKKCPKMLNKIVFRYDIHPDYIFELSNYPTDEFDSYILLIILHALKNLKKDEVEKEIASIEWYIPCLLNKRQNDFYELSHKIIEIYISFLSYDEINQFARKLNPGANREYLYSLILNKGSDNQHASGKLIEGHSND
jgi:hypothetical protein